MSDRLALNQIVPQMKVHKSAVCIIPLRNVWPVIQSLRCLNDKSFLRWMPHVNLLYPFWEDCGDSFVEASKRIEKALSSVQPFEVSLSRLNHFSHRSYCTVWAGLDDDTGVTNLQSALAEAFPDCNDLGYDPSRNIERFCPHLSLANVGITAERVEAWKQEKQGGWPGVRFEVREVALISRSGFDDPFVTRIVVPLGGRGGPREVNEPYVAGVAAGASELLSGTAADHRGVWNFAYGANINRAKVSESRGLRPIESRPARLRGYKLSFRHRGGFGTVEEAREGDEWREVHGVLHLLSHADYCRLAAMEHEYRPCEVEAEPYDGGPPIKAIVFVTPPERLIRSGLPPTSRYLGLLQKGAPEWPLDDRYTSWLKSLPSIDNGKRGDAYYQSPDGARLEPWPKIYTGSQGRRAGRGRGRGGGRGRTRRQGGRGRDGQIAGSSALEV